MEEGGLEYIFHHADSFLGLPNEFVLGLFDFGAGVFTRMIQIPLAAAFLLALIESSMSREFSTFFRALVANIRLVFKVVFHPARKRDWI
jgi:hypothetical protein